MTARETSQFPRRWRKTIRLKDLLGEDRSDAAISVAASSVTERLKRLPEYEQDFELEAIVGEFEDIARAEATGNDALSGRFTLCDWFNSLLSDLYGWADAERVWIS